ncbi:unnamed protein product [Polarella glacialis]|uniref:Protein kinase domain-containing protein n=1 Tax=Polarella glacialis TaxID=89957 RepID=A0A813LJN8_POLGL|nr:unnamed protein product [Polarella glacialis]
MSWGETPRLAVGVRSQVLDRFYTFEYEVGLWTYGAVQVLKERRGGMLRTCKTVEKAMLKDPVAVLMRLQKLRGLQHPLLCGIREVLEDPHHYFIVSDRMAGGDVADWLDWLDEDDMIQEETCAAYVGQVLVALAYCHSHGCYHQDLRPNNVLLTSREGDARVMVSDVGIAIALDPESAVRIKDGGGDLSLNLVLRMRAAATRVNVEVHAARTGTVLLKAELIHLTMARVRQALENAGVSGSMEAKLLIDGQELEDSQLLPDFGKGHTAVLQFATEAARLPESVQVEVREAMTGELVHEATLQIGLVSELRASLAQASIGPVVRPDGTDGAPAKKWEGRLAERRASAVWRGDSVAMVLIGGKEMPRLMEELRVGDEVLTGSPCPSQRQRRVGRIWRSLVPGGKTEVVQLSCDCRLTSNHPAMTGDRWLPAASLGLPVLSPEEFVFGIELEGHVDTILIGGVVCAGLGVYCGPDFGWNVFTRKTIHCEDLSCNKCKIAFDPNIDFNSIKASDLGEMYTPY